MKVLSIGTDRNLFNIESSARKRMVNYGTLAEELHIIVFAKKELNLGPQKIATNVFIYPTNSISRWTYLIDAIKMGKEMEGFDLITTQDPFETGLVGLRLSKYLKTKLHVQIHTDFLSLYFVKGGFLNFLRVKIAGYVLPKADAVRVVSSRIKKSLTIYELKTEPVVLPILTEAKTSKTDFNLHNKYPNLKFILLTVSRLEKEKNISLAIEVAKALGQDFGLVIVGDGNLREKLEKQAKGYNVFFEGWQNDLVSYYKTADCYLNTSNYEGYGLSLVEAIFNGLPVVSTNVGVSGDILLHKINSLICPVGDRKCLIESVASLNKELLNKFRDSNERISKELTIGWYDYLEKYRKSWLKAINS